MRTPFDGYGQQVAVQTCPLQSLVPTGSGMSVSFWIYLLSQGSMNSDRSSATAPFGELSPLRLSDCTSKVVIHHLFSGLHISLAGSECQTNWSKGVVLNLFSRLAYSDLLRPSAPRRIRRTRSVLRAAKKSPLGEVFYAFRSTRAAAGTSLRRFDNIVAATKG